MNFNPIGTILLKIKPEFFDHWTKSKFDLGFLNCLKLVNKIYLMVMK